MVFFDGGLFSAPNLASYSLVSEGIGGIASSFGDYYASQGEKLSLHHQARIDELNARTAELRAKDALRRGARDEQVVRLKTSKLKSSQRASFAARGIDLTSETAVNILAETDIFGEIDANTVASNAAKEAWGYRTEGLNYQNQAMINRTTAGNISPFMDAAPTLLDTADSVASGVADLRRAYGG